jgi:phosphoribosylamine-glycine ligase/phosphoribosylaminoimidazole (AIR) synthetase
MRILILGTNAVEAKIISELSNKNEVFCMGNYKNPSISKYVKHYSHEEPTFENIYEYVLSYKINLVFFGTNANKIYNCFEQLQDKNILCYGIDNIYNILSNDKNYIYELIDNQKYKLEKYKPYFPLSINIQNWESLNNIINKIKYKYVIKLNDSIKIQSKHFDNFEEVASLCQYSLEQGKNIQLEEYIEGEEYQLCGLCNEENYTFLPVLKSYRYSFDDDIGPITHGMGCVSMYDRFPFLTSNDIQISKEICNVLHQNIYKDLGRDKPPKYVFNATFIKMKHNIKIISFEYQIPDPGFINYLELFDVSLDKILNDTLSNKVFDISIKNTNTLTKYFVPEGYPNDPIKNANMKLCYFPDMHKLIYSGITFTSDRKIKLTGDKAVCLSISNKDIFKMAEESNLYNNYVSGPLRSRKDIGIIKTKDRDDNFLQKTIEYTNKYIKKTYNSNTHKNKNFVSYNLSDSNLITIHKKITNKCNFILNYNNVNHLNFIGNEIINLCINECLSHNATPLFYINNLDFNKIDTQQINHLIKGISDQCEKNDIVFIKNNISENEDIIKENKINISGLLLSKITDIKTNQLLVTTNILALPCDWINLNIFEKSNTLSSCLINDIDLIYKLTTPITNFSKEIQILKTNNIDIKNIISLDNSGLVTALTNILPKNLSLDIFENVLAIPEYYNKLAGILNLNETLDVVKELNCGYGMLVLASPDETFKYLELLEGIKVIGEITLKKKNKVNFITKDLNEYKNILLEKSNKSSINFDENKSCYQDIDQNTELNIYENDNDIDESESRLGLWNIFWGQRTSIENHMGACDIMDIATNYFDDNNIKLVEDWGCGNCRLKKYIERFNIQYIGVDGSNTGYQDKIKDLVRYQTNVDGIYMQHVLEHNSEWEEILKNMLLSFTKKAVLILFTPFTEETKILTKKTLKDKNKFGHSVTVNDISFKKEDIVNMLEKYNIKWSLETVKSGHNYKLDHIFKLSRI